MTRFIPNSPNMDSMWSKDFDPATHYFEHVCDYSKVILPATRKPPTDEQIEAIRASCEAQAEVESATVKDKVLTVKAIRPIGGLAPRTSITCKAREQA